MLTVALLCLLSLSLEVRAQLRPRLRLNDIRIVDAASPANDPTTENMIIVTQGGCRDTRMEPSSQARCPVSLSRPSVTGSGENQQFMILLPPSLSRQASESGMIINPVVFRL